MEVILREHVDNLGRRGDLVKVADGYARNYLLPLEEQKSAQAVADRMAAVEIEISRRVGETEALYGSVTSADIADALAAKGFELDRRKLQLPDAIKRVGEYQVPIKLHRDVTVQLKVRVVAEGAEKK
jgi:large subunit ribosomal protein L9